MKSRILKDKILLVRLGAAICLIIALAMVIAMRYEASEISESFETPAVITPSASSEPTITPIGTSATKKGVTIDNLNAREHPTTGSEIIKVLPRGSKVEFKEFNTEWYQTQIDGKTAYLYKDYVRLDDTGFDYIDVHDGGSKGFVEYTTITNTSSRAYTIQDKYAYTGNRGLREVENRYCINIESNIGIAIGTYVDLVLMNGSTIPCIVSNQTSIYNTTSEYENNISIQFIVDSVQFLSFAQTMGDVSYLNTSWQSPIAGIRIYNINIFN